MRSVLVLLICGLLVGACQTTSVTPVTLKTGMKFENFLRPNHLSIQIPLPEGEWEVGSISQQIHDATLINFLYGILFQTIDGKLSKAISFSVPNEVTHVHRINSKPCYDGMIGDFKPHYYKYQRIGTWAGCRFVTHLTPIANLEEIVKKFGGFGKFVSSEKPIKQFKQYLAQKNIEFSRPALMSVFRMHGRSNVIGVSYYFNPENAGFPKLSESTLKENHWHPDPVAKNPKKLAYLVHLKRWTNEWRHIVKKGFYGELKNSFKRPISVKARYKLDPSPIVDVANNPDKVRVTFIRRNILPVGGVARIQINDLEISKLYWRGTYTHTNQPAGKAKISVDVGYYGGTHTISKYFEPATEYYFEILPVKHSDYSNGVFTLSQVNKGYAMEEISKLELIQSTSFSSSRESFENHPHKVEKPSSPTTTKTSKSTKTGKIDKRLRDLKKLVDDGLVTPDEAATKRKQILKEM